MPQISVIVPVYNVEKYIHRCVDSILSQTFGDFELILVDDGSPDNCGAICDEYAAKDSRVRVIHQKNGGLSAARNAGIDAAVGKYIMFCDSDDYVAKNWCDEMHNAIVENPLAFVVSNVARVSNYQVAPTSVMYDNEKTPFVATSYFELYKKSVSAYACNKIYNRTILQARNLRFDTSCRYAEDVEFNVQYCLHCETIVYIDREMYFYVQNEDSIMHRYYPDLFELHLPLFWSRLLLITGKDEIEYCDIWLYNFIHLFENTFDKRNTMSFLRKMRYNQRMVNTKEFQYCLAHASGEKENPLMLKILRAKNYYLYWLFDRLSKQKRKIGEKL